MQEDEDLKTLATESVPLTKRAHKAPKISLSSSITTIVLSSEKKAAESPKVNHSFSLRRSWSEEHIYCILFNSVLFIVLMAFVIHVASLNDSTFVRHRMIFKFSKKSDWCGHLITKPPSSPASGVFVIYADMKQFAELDTIKFEKFIKIWFAISVAPHDSSHGVISVIPVVNDLLYAAGVSIDDNSVFILPLADVEPKTLPSWIMENHARTPTKVNYTATSQKLQFEIRLDFQEHRVRVRACPQTECDTNVSLETYPPVSDFVKLEIPEDDETLLYAMGDIKRLSGNASFECTVVETASQKEVCWRLSKNNTFEPIFCSDYENSSSVDEVPSLDDEDAWQENLRPDRNASSWENSNETSLEPTPPVSVRESDTGLQGPVALPDPKPDEEPPLRKTPPPAVVLEQATADNGSTATRTRVPTPPGTSSSATTETPSRLSFEEIQSSPEDSAAAPSSRSDRGPAEDIKSGRNTVGSLGDRSDGILGPRETLPEGNSDRSETNGMSSQTPVIAGEPVHRPIEEFEAHRTAQGEVNAANISQGTTTTIKSESMGVSPSAFALEASAASPGSIDLGNERSLYPNALGGISSSMSSARLDHSTGLEDGPLDEENLPARTTETTSADSVINSSIALATRRQADTKNPTRVHEEYLISFSTASASELPGKSSDVELPDISPMMTRASEPFDSDHPTAHGASADERAELVTSTAEEVPKSFASAAVRTSAESSRADANSEIPPTTRGLVDSDKATSLVRSIASQEDEEQETPVVEGIVRSPVSVATREHAASTTERVDSSAARVVVTGDGEPNDALNRRNVLIPRNQHFTERAYTREPDHAQAARKTTLGSPLDSTDPNHPTSDVLAAIGVLEEESSERGAGDPRPSDQFQQRSPLASAHILGSADPIVEESPVDRLPEVPEGSTHEFPQRTPLEPARQNGPADHDTFSLTGGKADEPRETTTRESTTGAVTATPPWSGTIMSTSREAELSLIKEILVLDDSSLSAPVARNSSPGGVQPTL